MPRERTGGRDGDESVGLEPSGGRWLTIHEACAFLGVDQSTLRRWSDSGKVPVFRTPGGHRRYAEADLRALVGEGPRLQERTRVSRHTLTDRSLSFLQAWPFTDEGPQIGFGIPSVTARCSEDR